MEDLAECHQVLSSTFFFKDTWPEACYQVDKGTISDWKSYKDLGILVTDSLAWSKHMSCICSCA